MTALRLRTGVFRQVLATIFAIFTFGVAGVGYWFYQSEVKEIRQSESEEIASVANLKVSQVLQWRKERLIDVVRDASSPFLIESMEMIAGNAEMPEIRNRVNRTMEVVLRGATYTQAMVLSPSGRVLFSAGAGPGTLNAATLRGVEAAIASPGGVVSDFYRSSDGEVGIDFLAAIRDGGGQALGAVVLHCNADDYLHLYLQAWPTPSRSAETMLLGREGNEVVFLNELRHSAKTALSMRFPLTRTEMPAVQAVLGRSGIWEGKDYRNKDVLAYLCSVPETPWFLVAKMDMEEIMVEARYRAGTIIVIIGALILLAAAVTGFAYTRRQAGLLGGLVEAERREREANKRFRTILYSIGDAVLTTDTETRVQIMNHAAERLTGWKEQEALGKPLAEVFKIVNRDTRETAESPVEKVLSTGVVFNLGDRILLLARDGTERAIADSAAPIHDETGAMSGAVLVASDVTESNRIRDSLAHREQEYRLLFEGMLEGFVLYEVICDDSGQPVDFRYLTVNPAFERLTGLSAGEVIGRTMRGVLARTEKSWFEPFLRVAMSGEPIQREDYNPVLKRHFTVSAFRPQPGQLAMVFEEISERKRAEARVERLTQLYAALSQCNQAIVRSGGIEELMLKICQIVVETGAMSMAWIGFVDEITQMVVPSASFGGGLDYLEGIQISVASDDSLGNGPTGVSIRENRPFWCEDFQSHMSTSPWRDRAEPCGWNASASLPLCMKGKPVGALVMYSDNIFTFDAEVRSLLEGMAADVGFALESFAREAETAKFQLIAQNARDPLLLVGLDGKIVECNQAAETLYGYTHAELLQLGVNDLRAGAEAIRRIRAAEGGTEVKIVSVTASVFEDTRRDALDAGADDFLGKPFKESDLFEKIGLMLGVGHGRQEKDSVKDSPATGGSPSDEELAALPEGLVGQIQKAAIVADYDLLLDLIQQVAAHNPPLSQELRLLAEGFDYGQILNLLNP